MINSNKNKITSFGLIIFSLVFVLSGCSSSISNKTFEWKLQSQAIESSVDYQQLVVMVDKVRLMSGGRLNITTYPGGPKSLASGPDIFNAVRKGTVQMGNGWPNWWSAQDPAWAVMNAGPFDLMNIDASMIFFFEEQGIELANQLSEPEGVMWRPAWWPGMEFGLLSRTPISGLDDLAKKKVRIGPGLPSEVLAEASNAFTIPLTPDEIRPALETGELDAVEWTTAGGAWELGLNDISPYAIVPAIWQPSVVSDFLINKDAFSMLPEDLKEILETAIHSYTLTTTLKSKKKDIEAYEKFMASDSVITKWSKEDIERWRKASNKIEALYKARNQFTRDLIERKQAFKKRYEAYYEVFGPYDQ
jgi:TRAP-type mannitol/chloroaromatic compound transport system substrate-binding protein